MAEFRTDRTTGKWGRAARNVEDTQAAREASNIEVVEITSPAVDVLSTTQNDNIINLYSVGHEEVTRLMCDMGIEVPFQHTLRLLGPRGEIIRVSALFDGCAMVSAMCATVFEKVQHRLGKWKKSEKRLRMGNGTIIPSLAVWEGRVQETIVRGEFEVFDSGGSWAFLLGKPLLKAFRTKQEYWADTVTIRDGNNKEEKLDNEIKQPRAGGDRPGVNLTLDVKQHSNAIGGSSEQNPPPREVPHDACYNPTETLTDTAIPAVNVITNEDPNLEPESIFTRESNPGKAERVRKILQEVTIGPDVTPEQRQIVHELLEEYADCFALSIKEVNAIPGAVHKLNIPEGATFHTKIPPRTYNPDQRAFVNNKVDEMLEAGII